LAVTSLEIGVQDVRSGKILQEPADPAPAHYAMKTIIDVIIDADGKLFCHMAAYTYSIRIIAQFDDPGDRTGNRSGL
jgi:hypothetical protein